MSEITRTQGLVGNVGYKAPVAAATIANITLSGGQTIDGVAVVTGDRVLVKNQTNAVENGIYDVDTGAWVRSADCDGAYDLVTGSLVKANGGTVGQGFWSVTTTGAIVVGTNANAWGQASSVLAVISAFMQTVLDDADAATAAATLAVLPLAGGTMTGDITMSGSSIFDANASIAAHATTCDPWSLGNYVTLTGGAVTFTGMANAPQAGAEVELYMNAAHVFTDGAVFEVDGDQDYTATIGDRVLLRAKSTTVFTVHPRKKDGTAVVATTATVLRSYLAGCTLSTAGASATMSIAAGQCADSTNAVLMSLSAIAKTTSAWAVGTAQGGLDTGAIANSTWYHFYTIRRPDTGVVDVVFSTSASAPTLPTNYTQYRRIGSGKTNGSAQWVSFTQTGDYFRLAASVRDVNTTNPGAASVTATLASIPSGIKVKALINAVLQSSSNSTFYLRDLDANDEAPLPYTTAPAVPGFSSPAPNAASWVIGGQYEVMTNISSQIGYRLSASGASDVMGIITLGWIDTRGRDS